MAEIWVPAFAGMTRGGVKKDPHPEAPRARPRRIDVSGDIEALLAELTEIFSRVYLANAHNVLTTVVFIYGVTSLAALGGMIPYIRETTARSASSYAWQPGCALYACFSTGAMTEETEPCAQNVETLIDRALANGDE